MIGAREARAIFKDRYGASGNIFTPDVLEFGMVNRYAVELSAGTGIMPGTRMFGVTVLHADGSRSDHSESFGTEKEARTHIGTIN